MTKDERIALVNADIAAGRFVVPEWNRDYLGEWIEQDLAPAPIAISLDAADCAVLADLHEERGNAPLAYLPDVPHPLLKPKDDGTFTVSRIDKYRRGDIEDSFGRRLFRDGKGRL